MSNFVKYDKKEVFNEKIKETLESLLTLCREHEIPFIAAFAVKNTDEGTEYVQEGLFPAVRNISLKDDKIREISHIMHNYNTVNAMDVPEIDTDFPSEI